MNSKPESSGPAAQPEPANAKAHEVLVAIIGELCGADPAQVGPDFSLATGRLRSSLGRATLDAKIRRRLGVRIENLHTFKTVGELEAALGGGKSAGTVSAPAIPAVPAAGSPAPGPRPSLRLPAERLSAEEGLACGIDLEQVSALPEVKDYWEEPFYKTNFTAAEIAYCVSQARPRAHFAARWCAKEALKKCVPGCVPMDMNRIEVVRRDGGSPFLQVLTSAGASTPPVALSLTHTEEWALALVVRGGDPSPAAPVSTGKTSGGSRLALRLSLAAFVCSLFALTLALMHR